jgi:hypothetical protein
MAHKHKGQLTVLGEWARHLRPVLHRAFWKGERQAERVQLAAELAEAELERRAKPAEKHGVESAADIGKGSVK